MEILDKYLEKEEIKYKDIEKDAENISLRYRANNNTGNATLKLKNEAIAYAFSRMPATYEVVKNVIKKVFEKNNFSIKSVLDVGAGTGSATIAINELLNIGECCCYEKEEAMMKIGKEIMNIEKDKFENTIWKKFDLNTDDINKKADLVICSYLINELPKEKRWLAVQKLYSATNNLLIIIEPGTPEGYEHIKVIRNQLIKEGANIVAPCPNLNNCPLENDWCSFGVRVARSKIHKLLKKGVAPFEDEKFSYMVFSKQICNTVERRILRHPIVNSGYIQFKICTKNGVENLTLSKKDKDLYKNAKKLKTGDFI